MNRQFELFEQSHQQIRDFFLREDQLLGEERRKFEEWKVAQQQWLEYQNQELAMRQGETKQFEDDLQQLERDIQQRERLVQKQQQQFQQSQRQLQLAQQQHAQQMQQQQQLLKQQQEQLAAAQQVQMQQQQQLVQQEQQQAVMEQQLQQQRIQQQAKKDQLAQQAAINQQQAQALQTHATQQQNNRARQFQTATPPILTSPVNSALFPTTPLGLPPVATPSPLGAPPPFTTPVAPPVGPQPSAVIPSSGGHCNPGPIHTYIQDREEAKSPLIRQTLGQNKWTDPDFPPGNASLFITGEPPPTEWGQAFNCQWMRISDMYPGSLLFKGDDGGPSGADMFQGLLPDMWFLNALSCVAINPNVIRNLVVAQYAEVGLYEFRFWKGGRWVTVAVDDYIPVRPGSPQAYGGYAPPVDYLCSHSSDPTELWIPLMEKAYAKLHGSYQALTGGNTEYAMVDLTGGVAEHVAMNTESGRALIRGGGIQEKVRQAKAEGWLVGCVFKGSYDTSIISTGLQPGRTYALLDIREATTGNQVMLRLRNPWGQSGYVGAHTDSTFWMEFRDFEDNISALQICRTYNHNIGDPWYMSADLDGYWGGVNTGGQVSMSNPQYIVCCQEDAAAYVFLAQYDVPYQKQDRDCDNNPAYRKPNFPDPTPNLCCGVFVLNCTAHSRMNNPTGNVLTKDIIKYATFVYGRQVGTEFRMDAGRSYCLMPCQFQAGIEAPYQLYVFSNKPIAMRKTLGEGAEQPMPVFTVAFSTPPPSVRWEPSMRTKVIVDKQPKGEVLEEEDEKR